jgi:hypothetical protein
VLRLSDGVTLESRQMGRFFPPFDPRLGGVPMRSASSRPRAAAMGDGEFLQPFDAQYPESWSTLLTIPEEDYARYEGRTGRFSATLYFHVMSTRVRGTLPLRTGAALDDGLSRIEILRVRQRDGRREIAVRRWRAYGIAENDPGNQYDFALRNRDDRTVVMADGDAHWSGINGAAAVNAVLRRTGMGFDVYGVRDASQRGFTLVTQLLVFPSRRGDVPPLRLDPSWFDRAELVVLETRHAGTVTRQLTVDEFTIPAQ